MEVVSLLDLTTRVKNISTNNTKVIFIRINPYPLNDTIKLIDMFGKLML